MTRERERERRHLQLQQLVWCELNHFVRTRTCRSMTSSSVGGAQEGCVVTCPRPSVCGTTRLRLFEDSLHITRPTNVPAKWRTDIIVCLGCMYYRATKNYTCYINSIKHHSNSWQHHCPPRRYVCAACVSSTNDYIMYMWWKTIDATVLRTKLRLTKTITQVV